MKKAIVDPASNDARWQKYFLQCQEDRDREALKAVLKTKEGLWILSRIILMTGLKNSSYTGNAETYFREGRREIGIEISNLILNSLGLEEGHKQLQAIDKEYIDFKIRQNKIFNKED